MYVFGTGKKRESYLSEMSLLRDQRRANRNEGPVGSLTISDIRLPLKQDVMSRINSTPGLYNPHSFEKY